MRNTGAAGAHPERRSSVGPTNGTHPFDVIHKVACRLNKARIGVGPASCLVSAATRCPDPPAGKGLAPGAGATILLTSPAYVGGVEGMWNQHFCGELAHLPLPGNASVTAPAVWSSGPRTVSGRVPHRPRPSPASFLLLVRLFLPSQLLVQCAQQPGGAQSFSLRFAHLFALYV